MNAARFGKLKSTPLFGWPGNQALQRARSGVCQERTSRDGAQLGTFTSLKAPVNGW